MGHRLIGRSFNMSFFDQAMGSFTGGIIGNKPGEAFGKYADSMANQANSYNPYMELAMKNLGLLDSEALDQYKNPWATQDAAAAHFQESPYQKYITAQTQHAMNSNAANTGVLGSTAANDSMSKNINSMTGQFMDNYINKALSQHNAAMGYQAGIGQMGLPALSAKNNMLQDAYLGRAKEGMTNAQGISQGMSNIWNMVQKGGDPMQNAGVEHDANMGAGLFGPIMKAIGSFV